MNESWNTGWDPYEELMLAKHNINELARALAHSTDTLRDIANRYNHQQQIIESLVQQNQRLNEMVKSNKHELARVSVELHNIKNNLK